MQLSASLNPCEVSYTYIAGSSRYTGMALTEPSRAATWSGKSPIRRNSSSANWDFVRRHLPSGYLEPHQELGHAGGAEIHARLGAAGSRPGPGSSPRAGRAP